MSSIGHIRDVRCSSLRNSIIINIIITLTGVNYMVLLHQALKLAKGAGQQFFPIGRVMKLLKQGSKIANIKNHLVVPANITLTIVD
jgi:hypothetical protein